MFKALKEFNMDSVQYKVGDEYPEELATVRMVNLGLVERVKVVEKPVSKPVVEKPVTKPVVEKPVTKPVTKPLVENSSKVTIGKV